MDDFGSEIALAEWAVKYNAYERLAGDPGMLFELLRPVREAFKRDGVIPEWAGVDLLRGWAFYMVRVVSRGVV